MIRIINVTTRSNSSDRRRILRFSSLRKFLETDPATDRWGSIRMPPSPTYPLVGRIGRELSLTALH